MLGNIENENYLRSYLHNANVLIVGGADITDERIEELEACNYDIWVRVNDHYKAQGGRKEILYVSGTQEADKSLTHSVIVECKPDGLQSDWIELNNSNGNRYIWYDVNLYNGVNPFGGEHEWLNNFYREINSIPFTGMIAVRHLLSMPIKSLTLVGFDFYQRFGIVPSSRHSHMIYPQAEWLRSVALKDHRLMLEVTLFNLLEKLEHARQHRQAKLA